ncbi:lanC-like protein 2 [Centruroides vittatus]|uniref:lanC-like protein 2 n=1 Tax=Centruroides vittatus TaxID=120091 RepID=UPI0035107916
MTEVREFDNPYPEYDSSKHLLNVNDPLKLSKNERESLYDNLIKLLQKLESELKKGVDWFDYSVYTGTSGISLMYYHLSNVLDNGKKDHYFTKSLYYSEKPLSALKHKRFSFLCGDAGPLAVAAVLYKKTGKFQQSQDLLESLEKISRDVISLQSGLPDEMLFGRAGYLFALLFVMKHISGDCINHTLVQQVISSILRSGQQMSKSGDYKSPLMYSWHDKCYIGAAHGLIGILYMLLQAREYISLEELNSLVKPSIDFLLEIRFPSGNMPSSLGNKSDRLVHWCHGAPGAIHLFGLAYKVFGEQKYLDAAKQCGDLIWRRGLLRKGYGICHGVSGNAYAFLVLYQLTDEKRHLWRALKFAEWCFDYGKHGCRIPDRPLSLFEGLAGTIYFLADMLNPEQAAFPAFQLF